MPESPPATARRARRGPLTGREGAPLRVLLTGAFSSLNKGDEARMKTAVRLLRSRIPDAEFDFLTSYPGRDAEIYRGYGISTTPKFRQLGAMPQLPARVTKPAELGLTLVGALLRRVSGGRFSGFRSGEFDRYDAVLDMSGESLSDYYGLGSLLRTLHPLLLGKLLGKPVGVFAQSIGPFDRRLARAVAAALLRRVDLITVRDPTSREYLLRYGIHGPEIALTADPAFTLEPAEGVPLADRLRRERVEHGRLHVGVCASRGGYRKAIGGPGGVDEVFRGYLSAVAANVRTLVSDLGADVYFVPHVTSETEDERAVFDALAGAVGEGERFRMVPPEYCAEQMKSVISQFEMFFGSRMHANIAALSSCVPTLAIAYSQKTPGLMRMLGLGEHFLNVGEVTADALREKLGALWAARDFVREHLRSAIPAVQEKSRANAALFETLLVGPRTSVGPGPGEGTSC